MLRSSTTLALIICVVSFGKCLGSDASPDTIEQIRSNVCKQLLGPVLATTPTTLELSGSSEKDLASMRADGSWADQVYTDTNNAHWLALQHLPRLERITRAYCRAGSNQPRVLERILTSLGFWLKADPHNINWWHNEIGVPREVGMITVMLGDQLPPDLRQAGITLMQRANWKRQTGANLLDETWIQVMRGCIQNDPDVISQAFSRTWQELRIVDPKEDGIQADGSFHQHGPLIYNFGYGTVLLQCTLQFLAASQGTSFAPPASVMDCIYKLVLDGDLWMTRSGAWDFGVCGRSICRVGATNDRSLWVMLEQLAKYPAARLPELSAMILAHDHPPHEAALGDAPGDARSDPLGDRYFWCSDYMAQRRSDYFASIRMYSTRTANTDSLTNSENRKSHHIADGTTCLMVSGNEYFDIFPVWDWHRIPGTTIEQATDLPTKFIKRLGKSAFVGGASDGVDGCAAMDFQYDTLRAQKAWFCFDHQIVCLGAGIDCDTGNPVMTTLNQCLLHGPAYTDDAKAPLTPGEYHRRGLRWLWHDNIGYVLPEANIDIRLGPQHGAWSDIGVGPEKIVTRDVFSASIDHGTRPHEKTYAYTLLPGIGLKSMATAVSQSRVKIISNTPQLQAVWNGASRQLQAVFHEPEEVRVDGMRLRVDQPCMLLFSRTATGATVAVANPLNQQLTVNVSTDLVLHGDGVTAATGGSSFKMDLPGGDHAGETVIRNPSIGDKSN